MSCEIMLIAQVRRRVTCQEVQLQNILPYVSLLNILTEQITDPARGILKTITDDEKYRVDGQLISPTCHHLRA